MHFMREIRLRRVKCLRAWVEDDLLGGCTPWRCHTLANDFKSNNLAATAAALITFKIALSYIGQQNLHFLIAITGQICYHEGTNSSQNLNMSKR